MNLLETVTTGFSELKATLSTKVALESELTQARAELADAKAALIVAQTEAAGASQIASQFTANLAAKDTEIAALQASITAKDGEIAGLKSEAKTLGERAVALVAGQGIAAKEMPASISASSGATRSETMAEFAKITDPKARAAFYDTHRNTLLGS